MGSKAQTCVAWLAGVLTAAFLGLTSALADPAADKPATPGDTPAPQAQPAAPEAAKDAAAPPAAAAAPVAPSATAAATPTPEVAVSPVVAAAALKLTGRSKADKADTDALAAYYKTAREPLWIKDGDLSPKGAAVMAEIKKAADWGLDPAAFDLPEPSGGASVEAQGEAEAKLSLAALKYARYARGGRIEPLSISNIWDMTPQIKDPALVIADLAASSTPDTYLTSLHPKHDGFVKLREALLKARGPQQEEQIDDALKVQLPEKGTLKPGDRHADVLLLRKRLKTPSPAADADDLYDPILVEAVKSYQQEQGIKANGQLNARTRAALNEEGKPKKRSGQGETDRIIANMERWRWLPENLGGFYVINNIPEFVGRVYKGQDTLWEERIIVGQTSWPTPMLTSSMQFVIFRPEWGMPDGIKQKELLPRLRAAGGGGGFFEQLFGGGGGGGRVIKAYGLKPTLNGRPVDPDSIDWSRVDIRQFSFVQPAGATNPLGEVKFRFPNRHDVYMHDTTQRSLFAQSFRALSHGCIRVQNPRKLAEVLLAEDKGWDSGRVGSQWSSGGEVTLEKPVPVYLTYFTARVDKDGKLRTYADIYGNDSRVLSALAGHAVRYDAPEHTGEDLVGDAAPSTYKPSAAPAATASTAASEDDAPPAVSKKQKKSKEASNVKRKKGGSNTTNDVLTDLLSGLVAN